MRIKRSKFPMNPKNTCTMKAGYLYPVLHTRLYPGDSISVNVADVINSLPMIARNYADVSVSLQGFQVPLRFLMKDWETFRTGGKNNTDNTVQPFMIHSIASGAGIGTLQDFLNSAPALTFYTKDNNGVYQSNNKKVRANAFEERAYTKIINDYYIKEDIQDELPFTDENGNNGEDTTTNRKLWRRNWNHDYFTNAYKSQQLGPQAVLPIGVSAPVVGNGQAIKWSNANNNNTYTMTTHYTGTERAALAFAGSGYQNDGAISLSSADTGMFADLSETTGIPISTLNLAKRMQMIANSLMQHGTRYVEWLNNFFGVRSSDLRLQRAQFLGSYTSNMLMSPVMQTSATNETSPQGNVTSNGFHSMTFGDNHFGCYAEEDSIFMILASIRPRTQYCQGQPIYYRYNDRYDYMMPQLAHLDFVPLKNSEIYCQGVDGDVSNIDWDSQEYEDNQTFGYKPIYQELRSIPSEIHGEFLTTLDFYHQARKFDNLPKLNSEFLECNPTNRQFAVTDDSDKYMCDFLFSIRFKRKLPKFGNPKY